MQSPFIELPIDLTALNLVSENGDPNIMAFSENQDGRRNVICGTAFWRTKCHSSMWPTRATPRV